MTNTIIIMGRLCADPDVRYLQNGTPVATFCLAVDRDHKGSDGNRQTDFIDCVAWRKTAEIVRDYLKKGRMIVVTGSLQTRTYEDKHKNKRKATEVNVEKFSFADAKRDTGTVSQTSGDMQQIDEDDDLPF